MLRKTFYFLLISVHTLSGAQNLVIDFGGPRQLSLVDDLPENILSTKSLVIIDLDSKSRNGWKKISTEAHKSFVKAGLDAVAYQYVDDIFSGPEPNLSLANRYVDRDIANIILIRKNGPGTQLIITPFSGNNNFIDHGQNAWVREDSTISRPLLLLIRRAAAIKNRDNLLIAETPEFYDDAAVISKDRFEIFPVDLRILKMGVMRFQEIPNSNNIDSELQDQINLINLDIRTNSMKMSDSISKIKLRFEMVDFGDDEVQMLNGKGIHFLLLYVHTAGNSVKKILDYDHRVEESALISEVKINGSRVLKAISASERVYKFYLRHIGTGNVFLGSKWDADQNWETALSNFLTNLRTDLKLED